MKQKERFKMIASAYLMYIRAGKILMIRRFNTGYADGEYSLPAGHLEENETLTDCAIREAKEEVNVTVGEKDIAIAHIMHRKTTDIRVDFFFVSNTSSTPAKNMEPEKCDDMKWFSLNALPKNTVSYIRTAIRNYGKKIFYSEFGW